MAAALESNVRPYLEKLFFWAVVVVLVLFLATGFYFLIRRAIVGQFISG